MSAVLSFIRKLRIIDSSELFSIGSICSILDLNAVTIIGFRLESFKVIFSKAIRSRLVQIVTEI